MAVFFDEPYARSIGLPAQALKVLFFALLAASTVAALQTVGAFLVIAMVVTPGATAYLLTDRFGRLCALASGDRRAPRALAGAYASYFLDGATGGIIVVLQTLVFLAALVLRAEARDAGGAARGRRGAALMSAAPALRLRLHAAGLRWSRRSWRCRWRCSPASWCCAAGR